MHGFFYNSALKNYESVMASLFSDIYVMRNTGDSTFMNRVPLNFVDATKDYKARYNITSKNKDYNVAKVADIFPKINFKQVDIVPNPNFAVGSTVYIDRYGVQQHSPVPINMLYELNIQTKSKNDSFMIIEQILPYMRPHFVLSMKEIVNGEVKHIRDIKLVYQTTSINNDTMGAMDSNDIYDWSIIFEMVGYIYPPQISRVDSGDIIETVYINFKGVETTLNDTYISDDKPTPSGEFESLDVQVKDRTITSEEEWIEKGSEYIYSMTHDVPLPNKSPSEIRKQEDQP